MAYPVIHHVSKGADIVLRYLGLCALPTEVTHARNWKRSTTDLELKQLTGRGVLKILVCIFRKFPRKEITGVNHPPVYTLAIANWS